MLEPGVDIVPQYLPWQLKLLAAADDVLYGIGAPHVLVVAAWALVLAVLAIAAL